MAGGAGANEVKVFSYKEKLEAIATLKDFEKPVVSVDMAGDKLACVQIDGAIHMYVYKA